MQKTGFPRRWRRNLVVAGEISVEKSHHRADCVINILRTGRLRNIDLLLW